MKKKINLNRGITLIALIITIIVLLILVSVVVNIALDGKFFDKAEEAVDKTNDKIAKEQQEVDRLMGIMTDLEQNKCEHEWEDGICKNCGKENTEKLPGKKVDEDTTYISNGKKAVIPEGFTLSGAENEDEVDEGLVIYRIDDKTNEEIEAIDWNDPEQLEEIQRTYDQFVWTPIADINDMYMCQSENGTKSCKIEVVSGKAKCTTHNSTLMAGRLYEIVTTWNYDNSLTNQRYNPVDPTDTNYVREPDIVPEADATYLSTISGILGTSGYENIDAFKQTLQDEYNEVVKSVCQNGGFYVGRYEMKVATEPARIVAGVNPTYWANWYVIYGNARKYSSAAGIKARTTMMQGAAYDQILKFVNTPSYDVTKTGHVAQSNFGEISNETGGRNYDEYYQIDVGASGYIPYNDVSKNIYDLEGNLRCWSTTIYGTTHRLIRGGTRSGGYYGSPEPASKFNTIGPGPGSTGSKDGGLMMLYI